MNKLNKFVNGLYRLRFLFISIFSAFLVTGITLLSAKGTITESGVFADHYTYGEDIHYEASAFLGTAKIEFSKRNENNWTDQTPYLIGEYKMRAYSYNGFGIKMTGKEHLFTIDPIDAMISIIDDEVIYGDNPNVRCSLSGTDRVSDFKVIYDDICPKDYITSIHVDPSSVKIVDANNVDKTSCYRITTPKSRVHINPRYIEVSFKSQEKIYDGEEMVVSGGNITSGSLAHGDELFTTSDLRLTEPGSEIYNPSLVIKHGDIDVTKMYGINRKPGLAFIDKIPYSVSIAPINREYNGKSIYENMDINPSYSVEVEIPNHTFKFTEPDDVLNIKDVCENVPLTFTWEILDENGIDVKDKYYRLIETPQMSSITITKKELNIDTNSITKIYDGEELVHNEYFVSGLIDGDYIKQTSYTTISKYVSGTFVNEQKFKVFRKENNNEIDITNNYLFKMNYGNIAVKKQEISVNMPYLGTFKYDGLEHDLVDFEVTDFPNKEKFDFSLINPIKGIINVGVYSPVDEKIKITLDNIDVTDCFDIDYNYLDTIIEKRDIEVTLKGLNCVYDGENHTIGDLEIKGDGLVNGETSTCLKKVIRKANIYSYTEEDLEFDILDKTKTFSTKSNYNVSWICEEIKIDKKDITVSFDEYNGTYDGKDHSLNFDDTQFSGDNALGSGDNASVTPNPYVINDAGIYKITEEEDYSFSILHNGEDVTDCYNIEFIDPEPSIINKRHIKIIYPSINVTYSGKQFDLGSPTISDEYSTLCLGHKVMFDPIRPKDAGTYSKFDIAPTSFDLTGNPIILDENNNDVSKNYQIDYVFNDSIVKQREIEVKLGNYNGVYDGQEHSLDKFSLINGTSLADDEIGRVENYKVIKRAGTYLNDGAKFAVYDKDGISTTHNYIVNLNYGGDSTINKRDLNIEIESFSRTYDGYRFFDKNTGNESHDSFDPSSLIHVNSNLYEGTQVTYSPIASPYICKDGINFQELINIELINSNIDNPINDYNLTIKYGSLKIVPRELKITTENCSITYGEDFNIDQCIPIISSSTPKPNVDTMIYTGEKILSDYVVGKQSVSFEYDKFEFRSTIESNDRSDCYIVKGESLTDKVLISERPLDLSFDTVNKVYDGENAKEHFSYDEDSLALNDSIYISYKGNEELINLQKESYEMIVNVNEKGSYYVKLVDGEKGKLLTKSYIKIYKALESGGKRDVTSSYKITYHPGNITIK